MWDSCNGNAIKATKANLEGYLDYLQNVSVSKMSHQVNTYSRGEVSSATYKMGLELQEDHFFQAQLDVLRGGVYADDLGWTHSLSQIQGLPTKSDFF